MEKTFDFYCFQAVRKTEHYNTLEAGIEPLPLFPSRIPEQMQLESGD